MASRKKLALTRVKELSPALCDKECNVKVIVLESNAKDEANASNNATLLVGDESGCVSLVLPKSAAVHVRPGDILQLVATQVVLKSSRIYLWGGKVERVGEFLLLFKESANMSTVTWVKDPKNPDLLVRNLGLWSVRARYMAKKQILTLSMVLFGADSWQEPWQETEARQLSSRRRGRI
ncbi:hypothetical protein BBJ28_00002538 [Nothophytophthora sp. Chile5]|nr:hypothetical protein BBJ28_00002538 [Nothophytophthora sp. Chile5]